MDLNPVKSRILFNYPGESVVAFHRGQTHRTGSGTGECKCALVRKTVEYPLPAGQPGDLSIVINLIQVESGLLSALHIDLKTRTLDIDEQELGNLAIEQAGYQGKSFCFAYWHIVALDD